MEYSVYENLVYSGVDCLGQIPQNWKVKKLRYLFEFGRGLGITKSNLVDKGIPCINYGEIHSKYGFEVVPEIHDLKCVIDSYLLSNPNALLNKGDFVFADTSEDIEGSGNFSHLNSDTPTFAGYHTVIARLVDTDIQFRYMAYLLDSVLYRFQIKKNVSGVKVFSITQKILKSSYAWIPSSEEQQKIASFLDYKTQQIDQLIEKKKALIEKLNEQRIAVITQAVTKGIDKNAKMKPSGVDWLGDVPEHWEVKKLKFMADVKNGRDYKNIETEGNDGFTVYGSGGAFKKATEYLYDGESVLFGRKGTIDKPLYVNEKFWTVDTMFYTEINNDIVAKFLFYTALTIQYQYLATQTALPSITQKDLEEYLLCCPKNREQKEIVVYIEKVLAQIDKLTTMSKQTIKYYEEYRSALITSAVTGKIDVRNIVLDKEIN